MTAHLLAPPIRWWKCPSCNLTDCTEDGQVNRFHPCPALGNVAIPLVEVTDPDAKVRARQVAVQREDGPGVASIRTERLDGSNDVTVLAQTATRS